MSNYQTLLEMTNIGKNSENPRNWVKSFEKVTLLNEKTKVKVGQLIYEKFHNKDTSVFECEELLALAWQFQIPEFDELLNDFEFHFYKIKL